MSSIEDSYVWCRSLTKRTAGNFYYSFLTLPADQFRDMCALYAFMRVSDDIGDDTQMDVEQRLQRLTGWREDLRLAFDGRRFHHPVFPALMEMVARRNVPHRYLHEVLDGIESDLFPQRFERFEDLERYCYLVAGTVGLCCIHIWGFRDEEAIVHAKDCGTAFQLTNILRDLREDALMGRIYLPAEDLARFGYGIEDVAAGRADERFQQLMRLEIDRTRQFYASARQLFPHLEPVGRPILDAMLRIYGGLLEVIARDPARVYSGRVRLPRWRKLWIAFGSVWRHRLTGTR